MNKSKEEDFFEIFSTKQPCDFCMKKKCKILRIITHPIFQIEDEETKLQGWISAKKCINCCREG